MKTEAQTSKPGVRRAMNQNEAECLRLFNAAMTRKAEGLYFNGPATWHIFYTSEAQMHFSHGYVDTYAAESIFKYRLQNKC